MNRLKISRKSLKKIAQIILNIIFFGIMFRNFFFQKFLMNSLRHQNCKIENTEAKNPWYDWLINYISEIVKNGGRY